MTFKTDSDVKLALMPIEGETTEVYIARLREMHLATSLLHLEAQQAVQVGRQTLRTLRNTHGTELAVREKFDEVMALSRAVGKARYEKESVEFALSEVFHAVNR